MNIDFLNAAPTEYLVLNATDEPIEMQYDGETFTVPPSDQLVMPNPNAPHRLHSGKNSLGELIPGSLLIRDIYGLRGLPDVERGQEALRGEGGVWRALSCIQHCLGIKPGSREATGVLAKKGLALLPLQPSPDLVRITREEAKAAHADFMVDWAQEQLAAYEALVAKHKGAGLVAPLPGKKHAKAVQIVEEARVRRSGKLHPDYAESESSEDDAVAFARQMAEDAAYSMQKDKPSVDIDALVETLMANPAFKRKMQESYNIRKKRAPNKPKAAPVS